MSLQQFIIQQCSLLLTCKLLGYPGYDRVWTDRQESEGPGEEMIEMLTTERDYLLWTYILTISYFVIYTYFIYQLCAKFWP